MADDVTLPGTGDIVAADEIGGSKYQRVKLIYGDNGVNAGDVSTANPLPISDAGGSLTVDGTVAVSGSVAVTGTFYQATQPVSAASLPLPSGAATAAKQPALGTAGTASADVLTVQGVTSMTALKVDGSAVTQPVSGTVELGATSLAALESITVADGGGSISVDDGGGTLTVDGTVELGATSLAALESITASISGTVTVAAHAVTNAGTFATQVDGAALTALQLIDNIVLAEDAVHASGDPGVMALAVRNDAGTSLVSATGDYSPLSVDSTGALRVTGGGGGTQYAEDAAHASGDTGTVMLAVRQDTDASTVSADGDYSTLQVNESGRLKVSSQPADLAATTGTITANGQTVVCDVSKASNVCLFVTGTFSTVNLTFEASIDGTNYFAIQMVRSNANTVELTTGNLSAAPAYCWEASVNAYTHFRVRATAFTSGTQNVRILPGVYATEPVIATQTTPVTVSSGTVTTVTNITNQGHLADNAAFTDGTTRLMMAGYIFDETAGTALTENDGAAARVDNKRAQVHVIEDATTRGQRLAVNAAGAAAVNHVAATAGGATMARIKTGASNNLTSVKASAGQVYGYHLFNRTAGELFVKLYNKASAPVVASDTPVYTIPLPPYGGVALTFPMGIAFGTGIAYAIVGGVADTNNTNTAADDVHGVLLYA